MITFDDIDEILDIISNRYGYDFSEYSRASIYRRISGFMRKYNIPDSFELKFAIINKPQMYAELLNEIVVNVSEFFRDPSFYFSLRNNVFDYIRTYPHINVWSAGCSFGEEAYSLAILMKESGLLEKTQIYGTDVSPRAVAIAKKGIYSSKGFSDFSKNYFSAGGRTSFSDYYLAEGQTVIINSELRKNIIFSLHNLVSDGVFNECHLILCRNVLIYFNQKLQDKVITLLYNSLPKYGFLAVGKKESLRFSVMYDSFKEIDRNEKIYQKIK